MNSFFTLHIFLEVGKTQDLPSKIWQTLGDALNKIQLGMDSDVWKSELSIFVSAKNVTVDIRICIRC
jgi:hypothetical protein